MGPDFLKPVFRPIWPDRISWDELVAKMDNVVRFPGVTNAWTMPIKARIDMLTTGVRTPVGIKVYGSDLAEIQRIGERLEQVMREIPGTRSVFAERVTGGYFVDIVPRRDQLARYGLTIEKLQDVIMSAIGGENITTTIEGRERYSVNLRYPRELREDLDQLGRVLVPVGTGAQVPIAQLADVKMLEGPAMLRDENGFLAGYVYVDIAGRDIGGYVEEAKKVVASKVSLKPGYVLQWSGQYENMIRVRERLKMVVPVTLVLIFVLLYMNTRSAFKASLVMLAVPFSADRRDLALLPPRLQRLHRRLGRDDRAHGAGRRDRRVHAAVPRPLPRRREEEGAAAERRGARRGDRPRRGEAGAPEDDDGGGRVHGAAADHVVDLGRRRRHEADRRADDRGTGHVVHPGIAGLPGDLQVVEASGARADNNGGVEAPPQTKGRQGRCERSGMRY